MTRRSPLLGTHAYPYNHVGTRRRWRRPAWFGPPTRLLHGSFMLDSVVDGPLRALSWRRLGRCADPEHDPPYLDTTWSPGTGANSIRTVAEHTAFALYTFLEDAE